jgi:DNA polymerase-3 subunit delta
VKVAELEVALQTQGPGPLYLLTGRKTRVGNRENWEEKDDCLADRAVAAIRHAVVGGEDGGGEAFNCDVLYGDESDAAEILSRAQEAPVFSPRRMVLLKAADKLPPKDAEALVSYLESPCEFTTLVFLPARKLDERRKFAQMLLKRAAVVDCASPPESLMPAWIRAEADRVGLLLNDDAAQSLTDMATSPGNEPGGGLYLVVRELEKLAAYVPEGQAAGRADVEAVRGCEPGASVFDLARAIGMRQHGRALYILTRNLEAGEDVIRILGALAYQFRQAWKAREQRWQGGQYAELGRLFSERDLRQAFDRMSETDAKLKGGSAGSKKLILESLLMALIPESKDSGPAAQGRGPALSTKDSGLSRTKPWPTGR